MLDETQLELLPERIAQRLKQVNDLALEKIGKRIKEIGEMKPSDVHKATQLMTYGNDFDEIVSQLSEISQKNEQDIYDIFETIAKDNSAQAEKLAKAKNTSFLPYEQNKQLKQFAKAMAKQTADTYRNMTNTIAFQKRDENGKKVLTSLSKTYQDVTDKAVTAVATGVEDYQSAMRKVIKDLADSGLRTKYQPLKGSAGKTVDYASGYSRRLDTAVRQNILWGVKECNQNISDMLGEELGVDGYEISYHSNPRPSHAEMGGKQYAIGKARTVNGKYYPSFSNVENLLSDYGCLHYKFPIILGVSVPTYTDKELKAMKEQSKQKITFDGKEYTMYECKQMQRKLETAARHAKDRQIIAKASGDDTLRRLEQEKINAITHKYKQLSDASGLPTKMERMSVSNYHRVKSNAEISKMKALTSKSENSIIKKNEWDNGLKPRGQLSNIEEDKIYSFVADELGISEEKSIEYVDSVKGFTDTFFIDIRKYQRGELINTEVQNISENIEEYIKAAPRWNGGTTYRGCSVSDVELNTYKPGYIIDSMGGTSSWSDLKEIAIDYTKRAPTYERPNSVLFYCDTQSKGTGIKHLSVFEHESEVLCSKESKYIIQRIELDSYNITHVYLKEV